MDTPYKIPKETVICPSCGGPLLSALDWQETPLLAIQHGIRREDVAICYHERIFFEKDASLSPETPQAR